MSGVVIASGSKSRITACSASRRGVIAPSSSPSTTAPRLPNRISPGAIQSAPKLMKAPIVRSRPTMRWTISSLSPFCSDSTWPSCARYGMRARVAASVCCAFTARKMCRQVPVSSSGVTAGAVMENSSTGPVIRSPVPRIAATCSGTTSTKLTSWPARLSHAPAEPPIAPAPQTRIRSGITRSPAAPASPAPRRPRSPASRNRRADSGRRNCRHRSACALRTATACAGGRYRPCA